jgi:hypothetical protein
MMFYNLATMSSPARAAHPTSHPLPGLRWAVKRSFLSYLSRLPDGRMSATDGAVQAAGDEVVWEAATGDTPPVSEEADRVLTFAGDLRYGGHGGLLFVRLADPHVTLRGDLGELSVLDTFSQINEARISLVTFGIARRDHTPGYEVISADEVRLTDRGAEVFNMVYPAGELFEPLTMTWPLRQLSQPAGG